MPVGPVSSRERLLANVEYSCSDQNVENFVRLRAGEGAALSNNSGVATLGLLVGAIVGGAQALESCENARAELDAFDAAAD